MSIRLRQRKMKLKRWFCQQNSSEVKASRNATGYWNASQLSIFMRVKILEPLQSRCQHHLENSYVDQWRECQYQTFSMKKQK